MANRQGAGEQQLWVADLATQMGDDALANRILQQLLEEKCLPAVRIAPLLRHLKEQGKSEQGKLELASRLAKDAAAYCLEPNVQKLAADGPKIRPQAQPTIP